MALTDGQLLGINTGGGLLGNLITNIFNARAQRKAQEHADNASLAAYNRDLEFWDKQNLYNSPQMQRDRLEAAGISPWTAVGQMNSDAASIRSNVADTVNPMQVIQPQMQILGDYLNLKKLGNETSALAQTINNEKLKAENQQLQNDALRFWLDVEMKRDSDYKAAMQGKDLATINTEIEKTREQLNFLRSQIKDYANKSDQYEYQKTLRPYDKKLIEADLSQTNANTARIWKQIEVANGELEMLQDRKELLKEELSGKKKSNLILEFENFRNDWRKGQIGKTGIDPANLDTPTRLISTLEKRLEFLNFNQYPQKKVRYAKWNKDTQEWEDFNE